MRIYFYYCHWKITLFYFEHAALSIKVIENHVEKIINLRVCFFSQAVQFPFQAHHLPAFK